MRLSPTRVSLLLTLAASTAVPATAQDVRSVNLPNPMSIHTWFIIAAAGAFLAWSISFAIQRQHEAARRNKERSDVVRQKDELLDRIAALEARKEAGQVTEQKY